MAESSELILLSDWLLERAACLGLPALVPQEKFLFWHHNKSVIDI